MNWAPIAAMFIAVGGMIFTFVMGYYIGYCDAREYKKRHE